MHSLALERLLVDERLDEFRVGNHEAKAVRQTFPESRHHQQIPVAVEIKHRRFVLPGREIQQALDAEVG